jgi:hypothetical protein
MQSSNTPAFLEELFLFEGHFASPFPRPLVFISGQMKNAMNHQEGDHFPRVKTKAIRLAVSRLHRNGEIAQKVGMKGSVLSLSHREGEDIGGFVSTEVSTIQFSNLEVVDEQDTEFGIRKCQVGQYLFGHSSYLS